MTSLNSIGDFKAGGYLLLELLAFLLKLVETAGRPTRLKLDSMATYVSSVGIV
jgi:hypothetical protein